MPDGVSTIESLASRNNAEWIMDGSGNVVARIEALPSGTQEIMVPRGDQFFALTAIGGDASADGQILGLAQDGRSLVIREVQGAELILYPIDLTSGERGEPFFTGANYLGAMRDDKSFRIIGARYAERLTSQVRYFDPELQQLQTTLEGALAGHTVRMFSTSTDKTKVLFEARAPSRPPVLALFDVAQSSIATLAELYPEVAENTLGSVSGHLSADASGATLAGMLVLPPSGEAVNLPTIILNDTRTGLRFDEMAHFLASHGYAVLRPDVRTAKGFGDLSGMGELADWVAAYQDSVASGLNELIANGIADPERVCIIGTGENGYTALMSVVNSSDAFQCAIAVKGVYDLQELVDNARSLGSDAGYAFSNPFIRNHDFFAEADLEQFSPVNYGEAINVPVLLIGFDRDGQVASMESALESADQDVEYVELEDNWQRPADARAENKTTEYLEIERFLSAQLGR
jgi:dipeptidyl aminopeptidase/acylaminoacyl peptidase